MKQTIQILASIFLICVIFFGSRRDKQIHFIGMNDDPVIEFPDEVKNIIDNKCYGCHNPESRNVTAKGKLIWDDLTELKKSSLVRKLDKIIEVLDDGSMPPSKYLKRNPDARLTDEEAKILKEWIETTLKDLSK